MKTQFVEAKSRKGAKRACHWAVKIAKVFEGYMCFESVADYEIWKNQK